MSSEVWKEVQLSTLELSITTRNSQLDLTVSVLLKLKKKKKIRKAFGFWEKRPRLLALLLTWCLYFYPVGAERKGRGVRGCGVSLRINSNDVE